MASGTEHIVQNYKVILSALRYLQIHRLGRDPHMSGMAVLQYVLQGVKHSQAVAGTNNPRTRLPITADIMRRLRRAWEARGVVFDTIMLWAVSCTCFFGFLRSGEATLPSASAYDQEAHLSMDDVSIDSPSAPTKILIRIKASKTDPFRLGVTVCLGKKRDNCFVLLRPSSIISRVEAWPRARSSATRMGGRSLTPRSLERFGWRLALGAAGLDASLAGNNFRRGAATTAAAAGVEDALIKILGRWQSSAYLRYVRVPRESLASQ